MKLINLRSMTPKQAKAYRVCLAASPVSLRREEVCEALMQQVSQIEPEVKVLGKGLAVPRLEQIDLVCVDGSGTLVLVQVAERLGAAELGSSLMRADWAGDNMDMLQHVYSRRFKGAAPRLWQLAGTVAPEAEALLSRMNGTRPEIFSCEGLDLAGGLWLVVKRVEGLSNEAPAVVSAPALKPGAGGAERSGSCNVRSVLTRDEIEEFFEPPVEEDEITSGCPLFKET